MFRLAYSTDTQASGLNTRIPLNQMANQCGLPIVSNALWEAKQVNGGDQTEGGNFEPLPGQIWNVSLFDYQSDVIDSQLPIRWPQDVDMSKVSEREIQVYSQIARTAGSQINALKSNQQSVLVTDPTLLPVGHADEMFSIIKDPDEPCGFSVLSLSPDPTSRIDP